MIDHFLKMVKGRAASQQHLTNVLNRLVLPMLTRAVANKEDVVSKENLDWITKEMLDNNPRNANRLAGEPSRPSQRGF